MVAKIRTLDRFFREATPEQIEETMTRAVQQMADAGKLPAVWQVSVEEAIHEMPPDVLNLMSRGTDYLGDLLKRGDRSDGQDEPGPQT